MNVCDANPSTAPSQAGAARISPAQQMVLDVLVAKRRHGAHEVTAGEVRDMLEQLHSPRRFDKGWATARLSELRESGLVDNAPGMRLSAQTGRSSALWCLPMHQARLAP